MLGDSLIEDAPVLPAVWDDVIAWVRTTTSINRRQLGKKSRYGND